MVRALEILLYVPNLIGYARILLLLLALYYMEKNYYYTVFIYGVSSFLDAFDGYYARKLNQSSKFGAVLDMLTDRVATSALVMCLAHFYPRYMFLLQVWMMLDISSHWAHTLASAIRGDKSHKASISDGKRHDNI